MKRVELLTIFLLIVFIFILIGYVPNYNSANIYSGDDAPAYRITKYYGSSGELSWEEKYSGIDYGNNLHQRGFLTVNGKIVPFNFLGVPFFYGPLYSILNENLKYINILFFVIFIIYSYLLINLFYPEKIKFSYVLCSFIFSLPLVIYFGFVYINIIPLIAFIIPFIYYIARFNKLKDLNMLYLSFIFSLVAIWMRYDFALFAFSVYLVNFIANKEAYSSNKKKIFFTIVFISIIFFALPLGILNNRLYGSPFTYGYQLFNKAYYGDERTGSASSSLISIIFPSRSLNLMLLFKNVKEVFFLVSPVFFLLTYYIIIKDRKIFLKIFFPYFLIFLFFIFYYGTLNVYGSDFYQVSLDKAIFRYWIPIIFFFMIAFAVALQKVKNKKLKAFVIFYFFIFSLSFYADSELGLYQRTSLISRVSNDIKILSSIIEPDSYLITAQKDKYFYDLATPITWWGGTRVTESDKFFSDEIIANLTKNLILEDESVYYLKDSINSKYIPLLEKRGLAFSEVEGFANLFKVSLSSRNSKNETIQ